MMKLRIMLCGLCVSLGLMAKLEAATLFRADLLGEAVQIELERNRGVAIISFAAHDSYHLTWLESGALLLASVSPEATLRWSGQIAPDIRADMRVPSWEPAMAVATHATYYHPAFLHDKLCAEALVNHWMKPFAEKLVTAIDVALLIAQDRLGPESPVVCDRARPSAFAADGVPLMIAGHSETLLDTHELRFDHAFSEAQLAATSASSGEITNDMAAFLAQD